MFFFSDIHIAVALASKSHAGSGYQCRLCLPTHGEAACRRPQSFLQRPWQRVDDRSRFYARCMEMASQRCRVSHQNGSVVQFTGAPSPSLVAAWFMAQLCQPCSVMSPSQRKTGCRQRRSMFSSTELSQAVHLPLSQRSTKTSFSRAQALPLSQMYTISPSTSHRVYLNA